MIENQVSNIIATTCLILAVVHTFSVKRFQHLARGFKPGSALENLFHLLGEIEVVFGIWAAIFLGLLATTQGPGEAIDYLETRNFSEPIFVFVIMVICSSKPILEFANRLVSLLASVIPLKRPVAFYFVTLGLAPLLGSFITEPAAMTVIAMLLLERFYSKRISPKLMYSTLGLLFVNVSIGGVLTPFAAPPVLMVAGLWGWDLPFMASHFGWKGVLACLLSTALVTFRLRNELKSLRWNEVASPSKSAPSWVVSIHLLFLLLAVVSAHHPALFMGVFLFFLGVVSVTREYQNELKIREGLLVGFFLAGLVILGAPQRWWLEPILTSLNSSLLYLGSMGLTAVIDNAAITYLGAQVPGLTEEAKYFLVAGAVVGGGLTVIANAPNPAGYGILNTSFGKEGISPGLLFTHALLPTAVAGICFWFL